MFEKVYPISDPPQLSEDTMLFLDDIKNKKSQQISTPTDSLDKKWPIPPQPPKRQVLTRHAD